MAKLSWIIVAFILIASLILMPTSNAAKDKKCKRRIRNCSELPKMCKNGLYTIYPYDCCPQRPVKVYCDMDTEGGGWTVIQRRDDIEPREDFQRTWMEYALGFGDLLQEFWLGLDHVHALTDQTSYTIRFDLTAWNDTTAWAEYKFFYVHDRSLSYKLQVEGYTGNGGAGDSLSGHSGMYFTTKDKDLDEHTSLNCATHFTGAWWYKGCHSSNLNGVYYVGGPCPYAKGVIWKHWLGYYYSLKKTEMKIRPAY